jgi:hypothetical protein
MRGVAQTQKDNSHHAPNTVPLLRGADQKLCDLCLSREERTFTLGLLVRVLKALGKDAAFKFYVLGVTGIYRNFRTKVNDDATA